MVTLLSNSASSMAQFFAANSCWHPSRRLLHWPGPRRDMMFSQVRTTLTCLFLLLALPGCSSWFGAAFIEPEVRLVRVDVIKAKLLEQRFSLRFRIDNPNDSE